MFTHSLYICVMNNITVYFNVLFRKSYFSCCSRWQSFEINGLLWILVKIHRCRRFYRMRLKMFWSNVNLTRSECFVNKAWRKYKSLDYILSCIFPRFRRSLFLEDSLFSWRFSLQDAFKRDALNRYTNCILNRDILDLNVLKIKKPFS